MTKKIITFAIMLILIFTLTSCKESCENCIELSELGIESSLSVVSVLRGEAILEASIDDPNEEITDVYIMVYNSNNEIAYRITPSETFAGLTNTRYSNNIQINYLYEEETYVAKLYGIVIIDFDPTTLLLGQTSFSTGLWEVQKPSGDILNVRVSNGLLTFDYQQNSNDYYTYMLRWELSDGTQMVYSVDQLLTFEYDSQAVNPIQSFHQISMAGLSENTVYTLTAWSYVRQYDYDSMSYCYTKVFVDSYTFKTQLQF